MQWPPKLTLTTVHPYFDSVLFPILEGFAIRDIFGYAQSGGLLLVPCISQVLVIGLFWSCFTFYSAQETFCYPPRTSNSFSFCLSTCHPALECCFFDVCIPYEILGPLRAGFALVTCVFSTPNIEPGHRIQVWYMCVVSQDTGVLVPVLPLCDLGQVTSNLWSSSFLTCKIRRLDSVTDIIAFILLKVVRVQLNR